MQSNGLNTPSSPLKAAQASVPSREQSLGGPDAPLVAVLSDAGCHTVPLPVAAILLHSLGASVSVDESEQQGSAVAQVRVPLAWGSPPLDCQEGRQFDSKTDAVVPAVAAAVYASEGAQLACASEHARQPFHRGASRHANGRLAGAGLADGSTSGSSLKGAESQAKRVPGSI